MSIWAKFIGIIIGIVFFSFLFSWPVMALWNACLIPAVDGIHQIGWMQAWGISFLCTLLFKNSPSSTKG